MKCAPQEGLLGGAQKAHRARREAGACVILRVPIFDIDTDTHALSQKTRAHYRSRFAVDDGEICTT